MTNHKLTKGAALFLEMGVGKSKTAIDIANILCHAGKVRRALVIAPLPIVDTWGGEKGELAIHAPAETNAWAALVGTKSKRLKTLSLLERSPKPLKWGLINVDGLGVVKKGLLCYDPELVVCDESTLLKSRTAQRTKLVLELFGRAPYKIIASGNPIPKSPEEIFSQYQFADLGVYGSSYYKFRDRFFTTDYFNKVTGFKPGAEVAYNELFHSIAVVKRKQDCLDLPPKVYERIVVEMGTEQAEVYARMKKDALAVFEDKLATAPVVLTKLLRLSQISGGTFKAEDGTETLFTPNPKLEALLSVLDDLPSDEQVVVWARFRAEVKVIEARLKKEGVGCASFYGETNYADRLQARSDFREKRVRVFIGNPATGGKGLNDLVGATTVVFFSNDYSSENRGQAEDRTHRSGTKGIKVTYIDLVAKNTIDNAVLGVLRANRDVSDAILEAKKTKKNLDFF